MRVNKSVLTTERHDILEGHHIYDIRDAAVIMVTRARVLWSFQINFRSISGYLCYSIFHIMIIND